MLSIFKGLFIIFFGTSVHKDQNKKILVEMKINKFSLQQYENQKGLKKSLCRCRFKEIPKRLPKEKKLEFLTLLILERLQIQFV